MFADRTRCATMRANQLRLYLSTVAYIVMRAFREYWLKETEMANAQCDTIRLKLLKIGAVIRVSVRRVVVSLSEAYAFRGLFERVWQRLRELVPPTPLAPSGVPTG